jgi:hypothetical protein
MGWAIIGGPPIIGEHPSGVQPAPDWAEKCIIPKTAPKDETSPISASLRMAGISLRHTGQ